MADYISRETITATIANGAALSGAVDLTQASAGPLSGAALCMVLMPAGWTTADITFQVSDDGTNFYNLSDAAGNEYKLTGPGADEAIVIDAQDFLGARWVKIRSGTLSVPVNQGAERAIGLVVRPI